MTSETPPTHDEALQAPSTPAGHARDGSGGDAGRLTSPQPDPTAPLPLEPFEPVIATILRVAERHPDEPAVVLDDVAWPYSRFATVVRALAGELEAAGIGPGDRIAVTGAKSHGLIAAICAVMARAAVLVPIDPVLPGERRREMVEEAGARILVEAAEPGGPPPFDLGGLDVSRYAIPPMPELDERGRALAAAYRVPAIDGDDPAYLLFTSGTTGRPKGIVGRQRGLAHFLRWEREMLEAGPGDRLAQLTGLSFDVVLRDLFLPLTSGAALHLPPVVPGTTPPADILRFLADDRITLMHAVPTIAGYWLADLPDSLALPDLRWVLFAGEPLPGPLVERWRALFGTPHVGNLYGPTETTLAKCFAEVATPAEAGIQPVGRAIPGSQALVLDGDRLCDADELGEIVIRTPYRSLGYLGAKGEPRAPFRPNPFRPEDPDDLVYRTGDRGRYRADGTLEIHGRLDDQVKILGVRIEPAEVSAVVAGHPGIRAATVVPRKDPESGTILVAYVVPSDPRLTEGDLRGWLADRLIPAKVPGMLVRLDELPRNPNGKVDRKRLPDPSTAPAWETPEDGRAAVASPDGTSATAGTDGDGPVDVIEEIFRDLLPGRAVGPDDDFFRLGGHSLMAARLIARIEARTGVRIQVRTLFGHPSPRKLARYVSGEASPAPAASAVATDGATSAGLQTAPRELPASVVPVRTEGTPPPLFVIPGVGSRILFLRHLAAALPADLPIYALHTRFLDDGSVYERIEDLAEIYARDLRVVQPSGAIRLTGFSYGGLVALEVARALRRAGVEVELVAIVDTRLPGLRQHRGWSIPRSIPHRLLNLAAILAPLSLPARRTYLRTRVLVARQNTYVRLLGGVRSLTPGPLRRFLPVNPFGPEEDAWLAADRAAWARYEPKPYAGRITYLWATHSQRPPDVYDHREGWAELALGGLEVVPIPGSHLTVLLEPLVRSTAAALAALLRRPGSSGSWSGR